MTTKMFTDLDILELEAFLNASDPSADGDTDAPAAQEDAAPEDDLQDDAAPESAFSDTQEPDEDADDTGENTASAEDICDEVDETDETGEDAAAAEDVCDEPDETDETGEDAAAAEDVCDEPDETDETGEDAAAAEDVCDEPDETDETGEDAAAAEDVCDEPDETDETGEDEVPAVADDRKTTRRKRKTDGERKAGARTGDAEAPEEEEVDFLPELEELTDIGRTPAPDRTSPAAHAAGKTSAARFSGRGRKRSDENSSREVSRTPQRSKRPDDAPRRRSVPARQDEEKPPFPLHLALLVAIAAVILLAVVRLLLWNRGTELRVHSGQNSGKYIIEVNDNMVYLPDSKLEGRTDDGVTTILCLGNEPFSRDTSETGLAGQIASLGNVDVINAAFPGSQVTCENAQYSVESLDTMDDIFNLFYVSYAISIGDFSSLETVASAHTEDDTYRQSVEALKNTDFDKVDIIAVMYDGVDYINGMAMQNPDVPEELTTYVGSLTSSFQLLQAAYPYIRIVFLSPYYAEYNGASGRTTDIGNGTLVNYFQWAYDTCGSCSVSFLDNYYGSVNESNYTEYLSDGIHLNAAGATKVADHFVYKVVQDKYAEYDVSDLAVAGK